LHLAASKKVCIAGQSLRVFKSGTGTFTFIKKMPKNKRGDIPQTNIYAVNVRGGRGRGRGAVRGAVRGARGAYRGEIRGDFKAPIREEMP